MNQHVKFGADFFQKHIMDGSIPEPITLNPVTLNDAKDQSGHPSCQNALALRQELMRMAAAKSKRKMEHQMRSDAVQDQFVRIIRDGVAEEIKSAIIESRREIELSAKQGKLTQICKKRVLEFNESSKAFLQYKVLLEKLETGIELRKGIENPVEPEELEKNKLQAAKVQKLCAASGEKVIKLRDAIDKQIHDENRKLQNLLNSFQRCKVHLPKLERGKMEVSVNKVIETAPMEERIQFLTKLIHKLAVSFPQIKMEEVESTYQEALASMEAREYGETLKHLNQLFHFDNKHIKGHRLRAELFRIKKNKIAYQCELKTIAEYAHAEACDFFAYAESLMEIRQAEEAFKYFQKAVKYDSNKDYLQRMGDVACQLGQWFQAEKACTRLLARFPEETRVLHQLVKVYFEDNRIEKAYETIVRLNVDRNPQTETCIYLGRILRHYTALKDARIAFQKAVESAPDHADANYWLSQTEYDVGDFNAALAYAQNADELEPKRSRNLILLARCYAATGKQPEALECLQPLLDDKGPYIEIILTYSEICRMAKREDSAIAKVKSTLEKIPWQPMLKTEYGLLLAGMGQMEEAKKYLSS